MKIFTTIAIICTLGLASLFVFADAAYAAGLADRLSGRILLQVENHGESWYVNPDTGKRHYMGGMDDAYQLMRKLGLGISNDDFASFDNKAPQRLAGKILLKVEDQGKAYYVNPTDLTMHYLANGADAYQLMRDMGLGVKNMDLDQIPVTDVSEDDGSGNSQTQTKQAPQTSEDEPTSSDSDEPYHESCGNIREYRCPKLLEYEFTRPENLADLSAVFISSGPPLLRFSYAELQDDKLACVYEDSFVSSDYTNADYDFAYILSMGSAECPNYLGLNIRNKDFIAPNWKLLYPGYVKVDKKHSGHSQVAQLLHNTTGNAIDTYPGCAYNKSLSMESDATLRKAKIGYCEVNATNDGFKCADSVTDMYGSSGSDPMLMN